MLEVQRSINDDEDRAVYSRPIVLQHEKRTITQSCLLSGELKVKDDKEIAIRGLTYKCDVI